MTLDAALSVLGLVRPVRWVEARQRWRSLARTHHPDRGGDPAEFRRIREAWEVVDAGLTDPASGASGPGRRSAGASSVDPGPPIDFCTRMSLFGLRLDGLWPSAGAVVVHVERVPSLDGGVDVFLQVDPTLPIMVGVGALFEGSIAHGGYTAPVRGTVASVSYRRHQGRLCAGSFFVRLASGSSG